METELNEMARLIASKKRMTMQEIALTTGMSKRQITYRLEKLNGALLLENQPQISWDSSLIHIEPDCRAALLRLAGNARIVHRYEYTKSQRLLMLSLLLFQNPDGMTMPELLEQMQVSRNTVLTDLKELEARLSAWQVQIVNTRPYGYHFEGGEHAIRQTILYSVLQYLSTEKDTRLLDDHFERCCLGLPEFYRLVCCELAQRHHLSFVESRLNEFIYVFLLLRSRISSVETQERAHPVSDTISRTPEAAFVRDLLDFTGDLQWMTSQSLEYLTGWVLGISFGRCEDATDDCVLMADITGRIIDRFQTLSGLRPQNPEALFKALYSHVRPAWYRLRCGIPAFNPFTEKIRSQYAALFAMTERACRPAALLAGLDRLPDDEIAFLCMHFAPVYLRSQHEAPPRKKALVVCLNGIGSASILQAALCELFPQIDFAPAAHSLPDFDDPAYAAGKPDLIFTSRSLNRLPETSIPIVTVSPVMNEQEKYLVMREVNSILGLEAGIPTVDMIMNAVRRHARILDEDGLQHTLSALFAHSGKHTRPTGPVHLLDQLNTSCIQCGIHASDWKEALCLAYKPLLEQGRIEEEYIRHTIATVQLAGPYIVIAPHTALVHTDPAHGSLHPGLALTILDEPVFFGSAANDPVRFLFALSSGTRTALASKDHLSVMSELLSILEDPRFYQLKDQSAPASVYALLQKILSGTGQF